MLAVSVGPRGEALKDTAANIAANREFVVNVATEETLVPMHASSAEYLPHEFYNLVLHLLIGVLTIVTAMAMFDYAYQRFSFMRSMRMSKQEVKEENKQSEGDPAVRARLRAIRMNRARKRMMAAVPTA